MAHSLAIRACMWTIGRLIENKTTVSPHRPAGCGKAETQILSSEDLHATSAIPPCSLGYPW
jgi:hypothetical protein